MLEPISRRLFLTRLGMGAVGVAVLGVAACSSGTEGTATTIDATTTAPPTPPTTTPATAVTSTTAAATTTTTPATSTTRPTTTAAPAVAAFTFERVNLGFVSAYILARDGEAVIVDTGVAGSEGAIAAGLGAIGLGWGSVGHVIITHRHGDHAGSLDALMANAANATGYAGEADIPQIGAPRPLISVGDGDAVFGLEIVETPGHTPGHISVLDRVGRILVAGDAINGGDAAGGVAGEVAGPNQRFSSDHDAALLSVTKLSLLPFDTVLFGHGEPVLDGGSTLVAALAAS